MGNKELLIELIQNTETKKAKQIIQNYLKIVPEYDYMVIKPMTEDILKGDLSAITDTDVAELLKAFGAETEIIEIKEDVKTEADVNKALQNAYNTTLFEIEELRKELKQSKEQLKIKDELLKLKDKELENYGSQIKELKNQLTGLYSLFNLTERSELNEVTDDEINELYINYISKGIEELKNAFIVKKDGNIIIPKSYYIIK